jgi:hypothetical protein
MNNFDKRIDKICFMHNPESSFQEDIILSVILLNRQLSQGIRLN